MLEACLIPELAAEITAQPVRRYGVDAAIFFSDITVPMKLAGVPVEIVPGVGPVMEQPYRCAKDVKELIAHKPGDGSAVTQGVQLAVAELSVPVLAFAGAPFTMAAYLVEGRPSRDHLAARTMMYAEPELWYALVDWCAEISIAFLQAQKAGGACAFQLFDSWAGALAPAIYRKYCAPAAQKILTADLGLPRIHFGLGTAALLPDFAQHAEAVGIDYRTDIAAAIAQLRKSFPDKKVVVQGNIDPAILGCRSEVVESHVAQILAAGLAADAHIVNLGHGVPKDTDPAVLADIVAQVHEFSAVSSVPAAPGASSLSSVPPVPSKEAYCG